MLYSLKASLLYLCFSCFYLSVHAQESPIKITRKVAEDRSVDLDYEKEDPGTYTVVLKFSNLINASVMDDVAYTVKDYSGTITTLTPISQGQHVSFVFSYTYIRGKLNPKYDANFSYIFPHKKWTKIRVAESGFANARYFGSTTPDDWKVYRFYTDAESEVTAVRKGVVVYIKDLYEVNPDVVYTDKINALTIEHADGTLATYRGLKKGTVAVKAGQTVFPGTVLGTNSAYGGGDKHNVSIMITYLKSSDIGSARGQGIKNNKSLYGFITPKFFTAGNPLTDLVAKQIYVAEDVPQEIVKKEMTKKELKQAEKQGI